MAAFIYFYQYSGPNFWIYAWVVISGFSLLMAAFYSSLILPLFNKLQPLAHGDLRTAIENYCNKSDFKISNLMVMDGSKTQCKGQCFFYRFRSIEKNSIVRYVNQSAYSRKNWWLCWLMKLDIISIVIFLFL